MTIKKSKQTQFAQLLFERAQPVSPCLVTRGDHATLLTADWQVGAISLPARETTQQVTQLSACALKFSRGNE